MEGREGLGHASILGGRVDPISILMSQSAQRQRNAAFQQQEQVKNRDRVMDYTEKYNPETKFVQLNQRFGDSVNKELREPTKSILETGDIRKADMFARKSQANLESRRREYDGWKATYEDASKFIDDNIKSGRFTPESKSKIRNFLYDEKGQLKPDNDIRAGMMQIDSFVQDPRNLNKGWVAGAFMKTLPEKITQRQTEIANSLGQQYDNQLTKTKIGLQYGSDGKVIMDERTGQPKISMTDDVLIEALQNPDISSLIKMDIPDATIDQKRQYVSSLLEGLDPKEVKNTRNQGFKFRVDESKKPGQSKWGINFGHNIDSLEARRNITDKIVNRKNEQSIGALGNLIKGSKAEYSSDGKNIKITYKANLADPNFDPNNVEQLKDAYIKNTYNKGKQEITSDIDISTPQARKRAQYYLSEILDSQNAKTSIGADRFDRYLEAHDKNNNTGKTKIAGF